MTTIREICPDDCHHLIEMFHDMKKFEKLTDEITTTADTLRADYFGDNKYFLSYVAELDGKIVGYTIFFKAYSTFQGRMLYMEDIYVVPNVRHTGIGKLLMKAVMEFAQRENCCRIHLSALDWNKKAVDWYKKVGGLDLTVLEEWHLFRIPKESFSAYTIKSVGEKK